ncbi:MAG: SynChlorMet cassette radical SAM/SPASM protein ScmE [Candidatus Omnitrophica bacterium]|nr:SynChlorMet cassette radical SAM/SPASM protein ScmE [Candidatus Omnitrophota bacterium]
MQLARTPKNIEISITANCNLHCKYCYHFSSTNEVPDLPTQEWLTFFQELNRLAVMDVGLCGGEPFYRKDLKEIIEGIVKNRMRFNILSNGTLITDEMAAYLASTKRCNHVQVSIDGAIPTAHEAMRGEGTLRRALEGIRLLQRNKVNVAVRVTIHRKNVYDLAGVAKLLLEELKLPSFSTNSAMYMGLCRQNKEQVQLTAQERVIAMQSLLELNKKYRGRINAQAGPLTEAKMWLEMERARRAGSESLPNCGHLTSCGGVMSKIGVRSDGMIIPCAQISHIELGRINKDSLLEIWQNHPELNRLRQRRAIPLSEFRHCKDCEYINYCRGGCPAVAHALSGKENCPSPDSCLKAFLEAGGQLPDESLLAA